MSRNLIKKLLKNYTSRDILTDEAKIDFAASDQKKVTLNHPPYGPPPTNGAFHNNGDSYGPTFANQ